MYCVIITLGDTCKGGVPLTFGVGMVITAVPCYIHYLKLDACISLHTSN